MISHDVTSLVKAIVAVLLALAIGLLLANRQRLRAWLEARETLATYGSLVVFRLLPFGLIYVILNQTPRDDVQFFYVKASAAFAGKLVYSEFLSYHAPLFGYFISLPLFIWHNAKMMVLFMTVMEFIIAKATLRYYRPRTREGVLLFVLYYLLPLPFVAMILNAQEDQWMWAFGLLTLLLPQTGRFSLWVGVIWGVAMLLIKFMLIVFLIPLFFVVPNRFQYVLGLALVGLPSLAMLYGLVGMDFLMPIQHSSYPMAPNLVSVLRPFGNGFFSAVPLTYFNWAGLLLTIGGASWMAYRFRAVGYHRLMPVLYCFTFCLFMIALPSSPGYYLFAFVITAVYVILPADDTRRWSSFTILNVLLIFQPMLWIVYSDMALYDRWSLINTPARWADYLIQWVELVLLADLLRMCYRQMQQQAHEWRTDRRAELSSR